MSYNLDGKKYFICINITEYDDKNQNRIGAERNTQRLIETFQNGVDLHCGIQIIFINNK